jgi:nucleotide-binding universal stress UspA family protein
MKILLATDGSECSEAATNAIASRPWPVGTEVRIVSVVEIPVSIAPESWILPPGYYEEIETAISKRAQTAVDEAAKRLEEAQGDRIAVTTEVVTGAPKTAIVDTAGVWGADLIVVGSHGYSGFERFLLGSVSLAVAQHARCSVEIVRCRQPEGKS